MNNRTQSFSESDRFFVGKLVKTIRNKRRDMETKVKPVTSLYSEIEIIDCGSVVLNHYDIDNRIIMQEEISLEILEDRIDNGDMTPCNKKYSEMLEEFEGSPVSQHP